MELLPGDSAELRKARGAFFTPLPIARYLAKWAIGNDPSASVMDPTCGDGVFLLAAGEELRRLGAAGPLRSQLFGVDLHQASLDEAARLMADESLDATLEVSDFFALPVPGDAGHKVPLLDAVVGNPPFIRYQEHIGVARRRSVEAAMRQGVRLNGLASSWAAALVHAAGFLKPNGRIAMVLPAELLTVGYAEPVRRWLRGRFASVDLVLFERLQFEDALADVVLLLAEGTGGCDSFSLRHVGHEADLTGEAAAARHRVTPPENGKWTDILVPLEAQSLYRSVVAESFVNLGEYGNPELGAVTGANKFFAISEETRLRFGLSSGQVVPICPPGTRHLDAPVFTRQRWTQLLRAGERVWLFRPDSRDSSAERRAYTELGEELGVNKAYKCRIREPWWRPPLSAKPDFFFTYMSHNYPRLIANKAGVHYLNSMHGVRLRDSVTTDEKQALPYVCLNSVTMLGAEINGRAYGGGILKMEPREAALLPVPKPEVMATAWAVLKPQKKFLDSQLKAGRWTEVVKSVDEALLGVAAGLSSSNIAVLLNAARQRRERRIRRAQ